MNFWIYCMYQCMSRTCNDKAPCLYVTFSHSGKKNCYFLKSHSDQWTITHACFSFYCINIGNLNFLFLCQSSVFHFLPSFPFTHHLCFTFITHYFSKYLLSTNCEAHTGLRAKTPVCSQASEGPVNNEVEQGNWKHREGN